MSEENPFPQPPHSQKPPTPQAEPVAPQSAPQQPPAPSQPVSGQQPGFVAPQPPYPGYPAQPPYPNVPEPPKKKVWPWILGGCLTLLLIAGIGLIGCVSCAVVTGIAASDRYDYDYDDLDDYYDPYDTFDFDDFYDPHERDDFYNGGNSHGRGDSNHGLTYDDIADAAGNLPNENINGICSSGVYRVGTGKDLEPGRYFFEGSTSEESFFTIFDGEDDRMRDRYEFESAITYFGNYFADLDEGDLIVFMGAGDAHMYHASKADFQPTAPYECGLFRVGTDIPAGTYVVTTHDEAAAAAENESAAFIMKDLDFDDDSVTEARYVARGGSQTVTVKNGEWLELYAAQAIPAE